MNGDHRSLYLRDNVYRYLIFLALTLSVLSFFAPHETVSLEDFASILLTLVGITVGAASRFFIVFAIMLPIIEMNNV